MNKHLLYAIMACFTLLLLTPQTMHADVVYRGSVEVEYDKSTTVTLPDFLIAEYNNYGSTPYGGGGTLSWSVSNSSLIIELTWNFSCRIRPRRGSAFPSYVTLTAQFYSWYGTTFKTTQAEWTVRLKKAPDPIPVTSISLNPSFVSLMVGDTEQLYATVYPSNATDKSVKWSIGNSSVATVSSDGLLTAKGVGSTTITCKANDGSGTKVTADVYVTDIKDYTYFTAKTKEGVEMKFYALYAGICEVSCEERTAHFIDVNTKGPITIPEVARGRRVIRINSHFNNGFQDCKGITKVTIPKSVEEIEGYAFEGCTALTSVDLGGGVKKLGYGVFMNCTSLTSITGLDQLEEAENQTFKGTPWFNNLPDGVVYLGNNMLYIYKGTMPNNTTIRVKEGTTSISNGAFSDCKGLVGIYIPKSVSKIGWSSNFEGCTNLNSIIVAPDNKTFDSRDNCNAIIETAKNKLVAGCNNTTIPSTVKTIDRYAFWYGGIKAIDIPDNIESIGYYSFFSCESLTTVKIGKGIKEIGDCAFSSCDNLKAIWSFAEKPYDIDKNAFGSTAIKATLYVPIGSKNNYKTAVGWNKLSIVEFNPVNISHIDANVEDAPVYTLSGQRLAAPRKGINIVGGKKVIIR